MPIVKTGNLFDSNATTLVNAVNCVGVMGKGIALEFKNRYPAMFIDYVARCQQNTVQLGEPYLYPSPQGASILNFPTKGQWWTTSRLTDIETGLAYFVSHYEAWGIQSIAFPLLGCGNGGLSVNEVAPLMLTMLAPLTIPVELYIHPSMALKP